MNLNSTEPNTSYDLVHGKPEPIQRDNDGSYIYRFSIEPQYENTSETEISQIGWNCREIRLFQQLNYENLVKAVISDVFPIDYEIELIRNYNAFVLKYSEDANDKLRYLQYMKRVSELKSMIKADLENYGIAVADVQKEIMPYRDVTEINSNATVEAGEVLIKDGKTYRAKLTHWKYQVTEAEFSVFYEELIIGSDGIAEWKQPTGAHDAYKIGNKVIFEGKTYESVIDSNVYSPSAYPAGWKEL